MGNFLIDLYLSPSTQEHNSCILGDVEETHQNVIADHMEPYLKASGITFARNNRVTMTHYESMKDSNKKRARMHYAMHTNANSSNKDVHGQRCYRNPLSAASVRAADAFVKWEKQIYRDPAGCRVCSPTIKYTEIYLVKAEIAVIDEIAYHTNRPDMEWVHGHAKEIAKNKVQAICEILGKKFVDVDAPDAGGGGVGTPKAPFDFQHVPYLEYGSTGDAVAYMQSLLVAKGYALPNSVSEKNRYGYDGLWTHAKGVKYCETEKVFRQFQKDAFPKNKSEWDGICGAHCWTVLIGTPCK